MRLDVNGLGAWLPDSGLTFEDLSFWADDGQAVLIVGRNGSGASTVLACLAGTLGPGARRVGSVRYGAADLTFAHPEEIATILAFVGERRPSGSLTVADLISRSATLGRDLHDRRVDMLIDRLSLGSLLECRLRDMDESQCLRARLAGVLARRPRILLLDQALGSLESAWKQPVCSLLREYCDDGGLLLWADQDLAYALTIADRVVEFGGAPGGEDAWRWWPRAFDPTPLQQLSSVMGAAAPGSNSVRELRQLVGPRLATIGVARREATRRGSMVPVELDAEHQVQVDDTEPPVIVCDSQRTADACRHTLMAANGLAGYDIDDRLPVRLQAKRADHHKHLVNGATLAAVRRALPTLRPGALMAWHSQGERAILANAFALGEPSMRVLYEPFRYLDRGRVDELVEQVKADWIAGKPTLVVTTDVEAVAWFSRVIIWTPSGVQADGRATAVLHLLPAQPLVAQVVAPYSIVDVALLISGLQEAIA